MQLSNRVNRIAPSATLAFTRMALQMREAGRDVISLSAGEPDFDTPAHIIAAANAAIAAGQTRYTAVDGTTELRRAIAQRQREDHGLEFGLDQILVSGGAKQSIFNAIMAVLNDGDEVIIPAPYWVSYPDMAGLAGGKPVIVPCPASQAFKLTAQDLAAALTPATRMLILNSPGNPTGMAYSMEEYRQLGQVLEDYPNVLILSDEIYEAIYWGAEPVAPFLKACPQLAQQCLLVNGVSKAYAMTGWRIGYAAGPTELIAAMRKIQGQSTTSACSISQAAAAAAFAGEQDCVKAMTQVYHERHDLVHKGLNELPGVTCQPGDGAFYLLPDFSQFMADAGWQDDIALATDILEKAEVALVPGTPFGASGHERIAYATSNALLEQALERLHRYMTAALRA